jgi:hypothetical protein
MVWDGSGYSGLAGQELRPSTVGYRLPRTGGKKADKPVPYSCGIAGVQNMLLQSHFAARAIHCGCDTVFGPRQHMQT